jgi:replicative DNA helicase
MGNQVRVNDQETNQLITIDNPNFYGPAIPAQDIAYTDSSCTITIGNTASQPIEFKYPAKPTEEYQLAMWDTLDAFEQRAWSQKNVGLKSGFDCIDKAFDGGLFPGFIIIAGDSNLGKTAFLSQMAWNVSTLNQDVYVMDFSLDDAMPDKLSRMAACSGKVIINAVKTPLNYMNFPLMLVRRKNAILGIRNNVERYRAYDSTFSTYIEDIEKEVEDKLIYFDSQGSKKKVVVFIDNFHDLNIANKPNLSDKEKFDTLAQWCSDLAIKHDITIVCSAELKKLNGSRRPILDDIRESVKIKFEAKAILLVYNEVHYKGESADIFFMKQNVPFKQPIFEVQFAKNKFGTYKGRNFFEFYPEMAFMKECDPNTQKNFTQIIFG